MTSTLSAPRRVLAVVGGGFCGTIIRAVLSGLIQGWLDKGWPYDILLINITGAFLLALVTTLADATLFVGPTQRLFLNVGVFGAYTTFSSLALGDVLLINAGHWVSALEYVLMSSFGGVSAVLVGDLLGQWCVKWAKQPAQAKTTLKLPELFSPSSVDQTITPSHVDVQDDLLLPDQE